MTGEYLASVAPSSSPSGAWEQLRSLRSDPNVTFHQLRAMTHYALQETQTAARIGNLLASFLWEELPDVDRVQRIHITGMATTAPLVAPMRAQLVAAGIAPVFTGQDFGMAVAELMNPSPIDADVVVVLLDEALVTARLPAAWSIEDMRQAIAEATAFVEESLVRVASNAFVVTTTVAVPPLLSRSLVSLADRTQLALLWREFDAAILRLGLGRHSIAVVDLSLTLTGSVPLRDEALHHSAGLAQSLELIDALAQEFSTIVRAHAGLVKKALITDLDNTLWGGILGDDGVDGINSDPVKGSGYRRYQSLLHHLRNQGILLAVSSKNTLADVQDVLSRHESLLVDEDDFVVVEADWDPKSSQIDRILESLRIGADTVLFVDDSPFERSEVAEAHAGISVIAAEGGQAGLCARVLADDPFLVLRSTDEDSARVASLRSAIDADRARTAGDYAQYLRDLDQQLSITTVQLSDVPRIAQMTMRTNQFHLVTTRMSEQEVAAFLAAEGNEILAVRLRDRLADHGVIGAVFIHRNHDETLVANMLLSCRVFGRGVEFAVIDSLVQAPRSLRITGRYRRTEKNARFAEFWIECGFLAVPDVGDTAVFALEQSAAQDREPRPFTISYTPDGGLV